MNYHNDYTFQVKEDDHAGEWMVELEGKCKEKLSNKRRAYSGPEFRTLEATERYTTFDFIIAFSLISECSVN